MTELQSFISAWVINSRIDNQIVIILGLTCSNEQLPFIFFFKPSSNIQFLQVDMQESLRAVSVELLKIFIPWRVRHTVNGMRNWPYMPWRARHTVHGLCSWPYAVGSLAYRARYHGMHVGLLYIVESWVYRARYHGIRS